ncbi:hypothetical protein [Argonema galeatum]|uniref:hypothetical protein n=1 Tax=Argonema galeatum TaxID=2942762 RepID=UPI0020129144|nr:hypothetical protein [Argonema galeatum]MCL1464730.1 hypothetical protein [Argonema galeatum A003/A1]
MQSIKLRSHVGEDGILHLDVPVGIADTDLEVTVTVQPVTAAQTDTPQGKGWPPGFFEETFGSFKDDPIVIDSEGVFDDWNRSA